MFSSRSLGFILCFAVFLFLILFFGAQMTSQNTIVKENSISSGKKYKHFKGHEYVVVCIARDTEDKDIREMVVYQDLHDANKIWVRPLAMFKEKVDKDKYPEIKQTYRFEEIVDMEVPVSLSEIDSKSSDGTISSGKKYRHFKGHEYVVVCIARDTEDKDIREMVVYQDLQDANKIWVRPLAMFKEKVDKVKYPEIKQTYRFEEILG
jgi:hypothetical protein